MVVERVDGLTLTVRPAEEWELAAMTAVLIVLVVLRRRRRCALAGASVRVLREYERGVVFRLGRLIASKGPGSCC